MLKYFRFQCYRQVLCFLPFFEMCWLTVHKFALQIKVTMSLTFATLKTTMLSTSSRLGVPYTHIFLLCNVNYFCSEDHCQYYKNEMTFFSDTNSEYSEKYDIFDDQTLCIL